MEIKASIQKNYEKDPPFRMFDKKYIWGRIKEKQLSYVVKSLAVYEGKFLDVACGPGMYSVALATEKKDVTGIDFSKNMITAAKEYAASKKSHAKFVVGDAEHLPFGSEEFDVVLFLDASHHMTDETLSAVFEECYRVLKKGGIFVTDYKNKWNPALFLLYKWNSTPKFYLQSRTYREIQKLLKGYAIAAQEGHGFYIRSVAPYRTLLCTK